MLCVRCVSCQELSSRCAQEFPVLARAVPATDALHHPLLLLLLLLLLVLELLLTHLALRLLLLLLLVK